MAHDLSVPRTILEVEHSEWTGHRSRPCAGIVDTRADGHFFFVDRLEISERLQFRASLIDDLID